MSGQTGLGVAAALCIMAKDEEEHILRALHSAMPLFDRVALLLDDKTTDKTLDLVVDFCKTHSAGGNAIPLTVLSAPWVSYGHNRNQLLELGKSTEAKWLILLDGDNHFAFDGSADTFDFDDDVDAYEVKVSHSNLVYYKLQILRASLPWYYDLPTHEGLYCRKTFRTARADLTLVIETGNQGERGATFYMKDAELLLTYLKDHPKHPRATYYLAQSFRNAGDFQAAYFFYAQRAALGGWDEEIYCSLLEAARCRGRLGHPFHQVAGAYFEAFSFRPTRAEALHDLILMFKKAKRPAAAFEALRPAAPPKDDILGIEPAAYTANKGVPHVQEVAPQ